MCQVRENISQCQSITCARPCRAAVAPINDSPLTAAATATVAMQLRRRRRGGGGGSGSGGLLRVVRSRGVVGCTVGGPGLSLRVSTRERVGKIRWGKIESGVQAGVNKVALGYTSVGIGERLARVTSGLG